MAKKIILLEDIEAINKLASLEGFSVFTRTLGFKGFRMYEDPKTGMVRTYDPLTRKPVGKPYFPKSNTKDGQSFQNPEMVSGSHTPISRYLRKTTPDFEQ